MSPGRSPLAVAALLGLAAALAFDGPALLLALGAAAVAVVAARGAPRGG